MTDSAQHNSRQSEFGSAAIYPKASDDSIVGRCGVMQEVFKSVGRVANRDVSLLIRGEIATGKALVAHSVWQHSSRQAKAISVLDCAAAEVPFADRLFGHGSRAGELDACNGGVLVLLEVGYLQPAAQVQLLRVLTERTYQRVNDDKQLHADVRVIATSSHDLETMCLGGHFREDLLHHLNGFTIHCPPLRERGADVRLLLEHYLARFNRHMNREIEHISAEAALALENYHWPGNVGELESLLSHAMLKANSTVLGLDDFQTLLRTRRLASATASPQPATTSGTFETHISRLIDSDSTELYAAAQEYVDRCVLSRVLQVTKGNQSAAAKRLGITRGSLRFKLKQLGLSIDSKVKVD